MMRFKNFNKPEFDVPAWWSISNTGLWSRPASKCLWPSSQNKVPPPSWWTLLLQPTSRSISGKSWALLPCQHLRTTGPLCRGKDSQRRDSAGCHLCHSSVVADEFQPSLPSRFKADRSRTSLLWAVWQGSSSHALDTHRTRGRFAFQGVAWVHI